MSRPELSIVLPVYNEAENLPALFDELEGVLEPQNLDYEIIAVDDRSTDQSARVLVDRARINDRVKLIFFRRNSGQTAAFDAGFRYATGKYIVTMDADLQNDPKDIPKLLEMVRGGYDFVSGWRKNRKDALVLRKIPSRMANRLIRWVTKTELHDLGCSLKIYRSDLARELRLYGEMHRFIGVLMEDLGARVGERVVNHRPRKAGQSKYGIFRAYKVVLDLITVWFLRGFRSKPSYVFGAIGFSCIGVSVLLSAYVLWEKFALDVWVHRNPLFMIAVFFGIIAIQFFGMGILAELIIRTYFESSQQAPYFIDRVSGFDQSATRSRSGPETPTYDS